MGTLHSMKVMNAFLKEQVFDDEVESIVNSRPLTKVYDDPRDLEAFTPMTFYNCGLVLHCRPGFLETEIFIPVGGGAKYNTYRTCFGEGGSRSIFLVCKNDRSGQDQQVTSKLETLYSW